ncbi:internal scaffolding protein [Microvirus mar38]|uniref:Internal scaffolding protein n=1 Tax=Microvirus mar38 TaxID=2851172 RepID=A0A8F6AIX5_9VIRU|nr:internal scaffolding protein [Microvirus mar38]
MPKFYTRFNPPPNPAYKSDLPSAVHPEFAFECDINNLVETRVNKDGKQFSVMTGVGSSLPPNPDSPKYGDFTGYTSSNLTESMNVVARARAQFEMLPSNLRARFENDPRKLVDFVNDSNNYDEALRLGLVNKRPELVKDVATLQPVSPSPIDTSKVTGYKSPEA